MESFVALRLSRADMMVLNNWRLYFKITLLLELCLATGKGIQPYFLQYNHESLPRQNHSILNWPTQPKPDEQSLKLWIRSIKLCYINRFNNSIPDLGSWHMSAVLQTSPRLAYIQMSSHTVYLPLVNKFTVPSVKDIRRGSANIDREIETPVLLIPADCIPADLYFLANTTQVKYGESQNSHPPKPIYPNLRQWRSNILHRIHIDYPQLLASSIENKEPLLVVSDGGVHEYHSNFGATIAATQLPLAYTYGKLYSIELYESSYRAEMYGMLAGVVMLQYIIESQSLRIPEEKQMHLYCDNRSVVWKVTERMKYRRTLNQYRHPDVDIELQP
jgi:hypothetical protein